jgi:hypothetical protein
MSSVVTIGFLDRTRACVGTEFTPPLADDERREILIHVAFLTARAFAALPPQRQLAFAGVLRQWITQRFASCPVQLVSGDPMTAVPRFASSFLAPVREYALATRGCGSGADGIEYFLPMATTAFLHHVANAERDPEELLRPALALCASVVVFPISVATHFEAAVASLPKVAPIVEGLERGQSRGDSDPSHVVPRSSRSLRETRRSLILSACMAALLIVAAVQYLSTRVPEAGDHPPQKIVRPESPPIATPSPTPQPVPLVHAPPPVLGPAAIAPAPARISREVLAYKRAVRDLAENSLAQVEVMLAAIGQKDRTAEDRAETLDFGIRRLNTWQRKFADLAPPQAYEEGHHEVEQVLADLGRMAGSLPSVQTALTSRLASERLAEIHARLEHILEDLDGR